MRYATPSQRRFVLAAKVRPADPAPNWALLSRLPAGADAHRYAAAVGAVLNGNDSFTEVFELTATGDILATSASIAGSCSVRAYPDLRAVRERVRELADEPFDLSLAPLYHAEIAVVAQESYFVFVGAHVLCDGFGFYNLITDFAARYQDPEYVSPSVSSPVDTLEPYRASAEAAVEHYTRTFAGIDALGIEGWDRRDRAGRIAGGIVRHELPGADYRAAGELAKQLGVRRFSVLLSAYALTVQGLSGSGAIVVSVPMSNRRADPRAAATRGVRVNALPVRFDLAPATTFADLCRAADAQLTALIEFEQFAFSDFSRRVFAADSVDAVQPSASFTVYPRPLAVVIQGQSGTPEHVDRRYIQYPLSINIEVGEQAVTLIVERSDQLAECDIGALYERTLRQGVQVPGRELREFRWAAADSAAMVPAETGYPVRTLVEAFKESVALRPDAVAVADASESLTYRQLDLLSDDFARWMLAEVPDRQVGVHLTASVRQLAVMLGVFKANKVYVPIDPAVGPARFGRIVDGCGGLTVLIDASVPEPVDGARLRVLPERPGNIGSLPTSPGPDEPAYVLFTSGTTGAPKGVQITHRAATRFFDGLWQAVPIAPERPWLLVHSLSFDISIAEAFGALLSGGTLYIPPEAVKRDPQRLSDYVIEHGIAVLSQTPSAFTLLCAGLEAAPALECVLFAGEKLEFRPLADFVSSRPEVMLVNCYGITETTMYHTAFRLPGDPANFPAESVVGRPFADVGMAVVDDLLRVLPYGVPGQLVVSGAGLMRGYLGRDDLTAARIVDVDGVRSYLTGDRGYLDAAGRFVVSGRIDRQVKVRGHRCELGEIEHAVSATGQVHAVHAELIGSGLTAELVCFVVPAEHLGSIAELRRAVRRALPRYFEPDRYLVLPGLPMNANSKVDLGKLMAHYESEIAAQQEVSVCAVDEPGVRAIVDEVWASVLGTADFDGSTRFFDAGGSSAMVIQVGERLRARLGVPDLHVVDLFEYCTPDTLTGFLVSKV